MEQLTRRRYTLEYKQEAVWLVSSGRRVAAAAKALGIVEQTLANWVKADRAGQLRGLSSEQLSAERREKIRLRAELARVTGARDDRARHSGKSHDVPSRRAWNTSFHEQQRQPLGQRLLGDAVRFAQGRAAAWNGFQSHREAKGATLDGLLWSNESRMHSTMRYLSPAQFEPQATARKIALAA